MFRILAGLLVLTLAVGAAGEAIGELVIRRRLEVPALYYGAEETRSRDWWGVLYEDALLLARAEKREDMPEDEREIVFVWPLWEWLLRFLGLT